MGAAVIFELIRVLVVLLDQHELDAMEKVELDFKLEELRRYGSNKPPGE